MYYLDKFLLVGDSITEMSSDQDTISFALAPALQENYKRRLDVVTRGFSGYNSEWVKHMLPSILQVEHDESKYAKVRLMTVFFGANDSAPTFQKVEKQQYKDNLRKMIQMGKERGISVILIGPAPVDEVLLSVKKAGDPRKSLLALEWSEAAKDVAHTEKVPFVDLWSAFMKSVGWKEGESLPGTLNTSSTLSIEHLFTDGLHFAGPGYRVMYDEITKAINDNYPELSFTSLEYKMPIFRDINPEDLQNTLINKI